MRVSNSPLTARHRGMYNADTPDHVADLDGPTLRPPAHYELLRTPVLQLGECPPLTCRLCSCLSQGSRRVCCPIVADNRTHVCVLALCVAYSAGMARMAVTASVRCDIYPVSLSSPHTWRHTASVRGEMVLAVRLTLLPLRVSRPACFPAAMFPGRWRCRVGPPAGSDISWLGSL